MAISFISSTVGVELIQSSSNVASDVFVAWAFSSSATQPTLPSGWTQVARVDTNGCHQLLAFIIAPSSSVISATFTNAQLTLGAVYRGCHATAPIGSFATSSGSSTSVSYPALTMRRSDNTSWVALFGGTVSLDTTIETAPTGFTFRNGFNRAATTNADVALFDKNGTVSSYAGQVASIGGTSNGWQAASIELVRPAGAVSFAAATAETEAYALSAARSRRLTAAVPEASAQTTLLSQLKTLAATVAEAEVISASVSAVKRLVAAIAEALGYSVSLTVTLPTKALSLTISEAETSAISLGANRGIRTSVAAASACSLQLSRLRTGIIGASATGAMSTALRRIRGFVQALSELWAAAATLDTVNVIGNPTTALIEWEEYQARPNGGVMLVQMSKTVNFSMQVALVKTPPAGWKVA